MASVEQVYAFHENPHNLLSISPSWLDAQVKQASPVAKVNDEFLLCIGLRGIPFKLRWRGVWREANRPLLLVDEAQAGPFRFWQHQHRFESLGPNLTCMTDHVRYSFPGGWLGKVFGETLGRLQFQIMFSDRHRRTSRWMQEQASRDTPPAKSA